MLLQRNSAKKPGGSTYGTFELYMARTPANYIGPFSIKSDFYGCREEKKSTFTVTIRKKRIEMRFGNDKSGIGTGNSCYVS
jgi:hypothetical protein